MKVNNGSNQWKNQLVWSLTSGLWVQLSPKSDRRFASSDYLPSSLGTFSLPMYI